MEAANRPDIRLFGSSLRTGILVLTALLQESYPAELAALLRAEPRSIIRFLDDLERDGVLATRLYGRQRRVTLNPNYYAYTELKALLDRIARDNRDYIAIVSSQRRRPRRHGKPL
jgi:DNA-binding PadR family transcriptional regulator